MPALFKVNIATGRLWTAVVFAGPKPVPQNGQNPFGAAPLGPLARDGQGVFVGVTQGNERYTPSGTVFYRISLNNTEQAAPAVHTFSQDGVTPNEATLHGEVDPASLATTAWFEHGLTTKYGLKTPITAFAAGSTPQPVDRPITKLLGHTGYLYRLVAKNSLGTTMGPDCSFNTLNTPPVGADLTVLTTVNYEHFFQDNEIGFIGPPKSHQSTCAAEESHSTSPAIF